MSDTLADHQDIKKKMDQVRPSVVQIEQLVTNSPNANANSAKWKQLANRAEAERRTLCKFIDGQALFACLFHTYAATYKETRDSFNRAVNSGQQVASQAEQNKPRR
jgi:ribosomal protein L17